MNIRYNICVKSHKAQLNVLNCPNVNSIRIIIILITFG